MSNGSQSTFSAYDRSLYLDVYRVIIDLFFPVADMCGAARPIVEMMSFSYLPPLTHRSLSLARTAVPHLARSPWM